jgi:hypothetical protein
MIWICWIFSRFIEVRKTFVEKHQTQGYPPRRRGVLPCEQRGVDFKKRDATVDPIFLCVCCYYLWVVGPNSQQARAKIIPRGRIHLTNSGSQHLFYQPRWTCNVGPRLACNHNRAISTASAYSRGRAFLVTTLARHDLPKRLISHRNPRSTHGMLASPIRFTLFTLAVLC